MAPSQEHDVRAGMLTLHAEQEGDAHLIRLVGELDLANADTLESELSEALTNGQDRVVVDMRELTFIDSTGLALLVGALARDEGVGRLRFVPSRAQAVIRVLELTGLDKRLPLVDS